ncbi:MAG: DUF4250 domain-containing protein [Ruminococcaceae bacterium]|nr:DUF4250 domain-containing protein [Oscillospiraceae bacterium]
MVPHDPVILLSFINTKLRDRYKTFSELCEDLDLCEEEIKEKLGSIDYFYDQKQNQFI